MLNNYSHSRTIYIYIRTQALHTVKNSTHTRSTHIQEPYKYAGAIRVHKKYTCTHTYSTRNCSRRNHTHRTTHKNYTQLRTVLACKNCTHQEYTHSKSILHARLHTLKTIHTPHTHRDYVHSGGHKKCTCKNYTFRNCTEKVHARIKTLFCITSCASCNSRWSNPLSFSPVKIFAMPRMPKHW